MMNHRIGIVIPTLGERPSFILECIKSVRAAGESRIAIVAPNDIRERLSGLGVSPDIFVDDPGRGAAAAINAGVKAFAADVTSVGWIGDDDLLAQDSFGSVNAKLAQGFCAAYGQCQYIDSEGNELFVNKSGNFAKVLMRFGPNLVPQPGSLVLRSAWEEVGGLDESLKWTFDLDLFLKLQAHGKVSFVPQVVASFRWHDGSLTAGSRKGSVKEASKVRQRHMPQLLRLVSKIWEPVVQRIILQAGSRVTKRISRSAVK